MLYLQNNVIYSFILSGLLFALSGGWKKDEQDFIHFTNFIF
ncbi:MAG: hypothetical protein NZ735_06965 [Candidatus Marinimicrobia bacterium]|nr:hypothetical protein [Candidatus Neomarinimicrobiota bacterium]